MSKSQALTLVLPETAPAELETILLSFSAMEEVHERLALLFQAMQGAALLRLQELNGFTRGGDRKSAAAIKTDASGFDSWGAFVKAKFGFSDDKARVLMAVWDNMRPLVDKLPPGDRQRFLDFLRRPMLHFTSEEVAVLEKLTHKITSATNRTAFLAECKYLKQEHGAGLLKDHDKSHKGGPAGEPKPDLLIQDELFGRFDGIDQIVKAFYTRTKVGQSTLPLWEHMTLAQKKDYLLKIDVRIKQMTDMRDQVKEALKAK